MIWTESSQKCPLEELCAFELNEIPEFLLPWHFHRTITFVKQITADCVFDRFNIAWRINGENRGIIR